MSLHVVDAADLFLKALVGVSDPEEKRKIIGREVHPHVRGRRARYRRGGGAWRGTRAVPVQGTLYPDVVESGGGAGAANISLDTHHKLRPTGCLQFTLIEPLRTLFKDEVRLESARNWAPA